MFGRRKLDICNQSILGVVYESTFSSLLSKAFKELNMSKAHFSNNFKKAKRLYEKKPYDIIFIDLNTANNDQINIIHTIKKHQPCAQFIVCSNRDLTIKQELDLRTLGIEDIFYYDKGVEILKIMIKNLVTRRLLTYYDEMTNALSKLTLAPMLNAEINKLKTTKNYKVSIANIDYNNFKHINDKEGHEVGDQVLKAVTELIQGTIRETDLIFRVGGDEFYILMPHTPLDQARKIMKRVCKRIHHSDKIKDLTTIDFSISVGIVEGAPADSEKSFKRKSDIAMYKAKRTRHSIVYRVLDQVEYKHELEEA